MKVILKLQLSWEVKSRYVSDMEWTENLVESPLMAL